MIITSLFVLYASTIYNRAIAETNTNLIANAVIILFVTDLDEMMLSVLVAINPSSIPEDDTLEVMKEKVHTLEPQSMHVWEKLAQGEAENLKKWQKLKQKI